MLKMPKAVPPPRVNTLVVDNWSRGRVSVLDDNRGAIDGLDESVNVYLTQDGVIEQRPALSLYGMQPLGEVMGITEITVLEDNKPTNYLLSVQKIGNGENAKAFVYYAKDGEEWTKADGIEYAGEALDAEYNFCQTDQKCLILNGVNKTHYFDFPTKTVKKFEKLSLPTDLKIEKTGLSSGSVTLRYGITAQSLGETKPIYFEVQKVDKDRNGWEASKNFIKLSWKCSDPKVERFLIYVGNEQGKEEYLTYITKEGTGTDYSFVDNGTMNPQPGTIVPDSDTSEGVVGRRAARINSTVFLLGDKEHPYRIYYDGGSAKTALNFSPFGGGFIDVAEGGKDLPNVIVDFRTGRGDPTPTVLMQGTNGFGAMKHLIDETIDVAGVPVSVMKVVDANGREGTDAPNAVLKYQESLHYLSKNGVHTTGTLPNIPAVLSTTKSSAAIAPDFKRLNLKALGKTAGMVYDGRLLWALPVGDDENVENNQIWVQDLERGGAWLLPWLVPAKFLLHYGSSDGKTHKLAVVNNQICEFNEGEKTVDINQPFPTKLRTSKIFFSKQADFARMLSVHLELINPSGKITIIIRGRTDRKEVKKVVTRSFPTRGRYVGWGDRYNFPLAKFWGWGKPKPLGNDKGTETRLINIKVNKNVKWFSVELSTDGIVRYGLHRARVRYVPIGFMPEKESIYG